MSAKVWTPSKHTHGTPGEFRMFTKVKLMNSKQKAFFKNVNHAGFPLGIFHYFRLGVDQEKTLGSSKKNNT